LVFAAATLRVAFSWMAGLAGSMRIALVCPYTFSAHGGVQNHVRGLAQWLRSQGASVTVFAPADGPVDLEGFVGLGRSTTFHDNGATTRVAMSPRGMLRVAEAVREEFDLVHAHEPMHPACMAAVCAARMPVVGTFHMAADQQRWYRIFGPVVRAAARRISQRIAVSPTAERFAQAALPGSYAIIPNAIDMGAFEVIREHDPARRRVLFIGRPDPRKGLEALLRAAAGLHPQAEVHLAGVSPEELAALAGRGVPVAGATAHGHVRHPELRHLLSTSDLLCTPSLHSESFGLTLVEGMAAGLPVIASALDAHRDVLTPDCGRLVEAGDVTALTTVLAELLHDPGLRARMGRAGIRRARLFDWAVTGPATIEVYEQALGSLRAAA
jgi:phosphatidylinositol alpha-mannosyltransferase